MSAEEIRADLWGQVQAKSAEDLYREQPYLRTVVDFLARNVAQLGLHTFKRDGESRERMRDHPVARLLADPNPQQSTYDLVSALVSSLALYDRALLWVKPDPATLEPGMLRVIPESWLVDTADSSPYAVGRYVVEPPGGNAFEISAFDVIEFHGWNPTDLRVGVSPVEALKSILAEQLSAAEYRQQNWAKGGRVGAYLTRPAGAPKWTNEARTRFQKGWAASYTGPGNHVGGVPLLEDGIELKRVGFSAKEDDYIEGSKLALQTVASVYHVNPTMLGLLDNANYSNVKEFRRGLYGDTLGPLIAMIEGKLNRFLVRRFHDHESVYVEFNVAEKLAGSFEEQAAHFASALNSGWLTVNEVRAMMNRPAIEGGDVLRTPLNMGEAAPPAADPTEQ
ncbi:MAG: phage portal protein [Gordonia sp. (in: high G+C Gram-positive bacteria)]